MWEQEYGPFTESGNPSVVTLEDNRIYQWHEISVSVFDATDSPATSGVTGTLSASIRKPGADRDESFTQTLNLATDQRSWSPEMAMAESFSFTATGLNAGYSYRVRVKSWSQF